MRNERKLNLEWEKKFKCFLGRFFFLVSSVNLAIPYLAYVTVFPTSSPIYFDLLDWTEENRKINIYCRLYD